MRSSKFHDALRRPAFDVADRRGNNPHGTREAAEGEGRRLNGYRYETVAQVERALDPRARRAIGEAPPPAPPPGGGGSSGGNGLLWLLAAGAGIALLSALSSGGESDEHDEDDADDDVPPFPAPPPSVAPSNITVNLTMPHAPSVPLLSNPAPVAAHSEPVHVTVPIMAPIVMPPDPAPAPAPMLSPDAPLLNPGKKRRRKK